MRESGTVGRSRKDYLNATLYRQLHDRRDSRPDRALKTRSLPAGRSSSSKGKPMFINWGEPERAPPLREVQCPRLYVDIRQHGSAVYVGMVVVVCIP